AKPPSPSRSFRSCQTPAGPLNASSSHLPRRSTPRPGYSRRFDLLPWNAADLRVTIGSEGRSSMPRKTYGPEQIIGMLREAEVALGQGRRVDEVCRGLGITSVTYYRWRKEYGGLKLDQAKRLKELERENARLLKAVSDLTLDKLI